MKYIKKFEFYDDDFNWDIWSHYMYEVAQFWNFNIEEYYEPGTFGVAANGYLRKSNKEMVLKLTTDFIEARIANYLQKRINYSRLVNYFDIREVFTSGEELYLENKDGKYEQVYAILMEKLESWVDYKNKHKFERNCIDRCLFRLKVQLNYGLKRMLEYEFDDELLDQIHKDHRQANWLIDEVKIILRDLYVNKFTIKSSNFWEDIHDDNLGIRYNNNNQPQLIHFDMRGDSSNAWKFKPNRKPIEVNGV